MNNKPFKVVAQKTGLGPDSDQARWAIGEIKAILYSYNMALEAYGRSTWRPVALAMNVLRKERGISYHEFQALFPFARSLYRECVRICGPKNPKVIEALWSNANIYKYLRDRRSVNTAVSDPGSGPYPEARRM